MRLDHPTVLGRCERCATSPELDSTGRGVTTGATTHGADCRQALRKQDFVLLRARAAYTSVPRGRAAIRSSSR